MKKAKKPVIGVWANKQNYRSASIVMAALKRSFSDAQVVECDEFMQNLDRIEAVVFVNPTENTKALFLSFVQQSCKMLVFGSIPAYMAEKIGVTTCPIPNCWNKFDNVELCSDSVYDHSQWEIVYRPCFLTRKVGYHHRWLTRYDFTTEWNNHGYGQISIQGITEYSLSQIAVPSSDVVEIARVIDQDKQCKSLYAFLWNPSNSAVLWFNRPVGPTDSLEWSIVEEYLSEYLADRLICFPLLSELPYGYNMASTMRLDCDQAIASARPLYELYQKENIPFSLAVLTGLEMTKDDHSFLQTVVKNGGAIVSHSAHHLENWGGSYEAALQEAVSAREWLTTNHFYAPEENLFAVSPFHQNPAYSIQALCDAGYKGFIGGIIHNDPDYVLGRPGTPPFVSNEEFISHSQQCMLHGDCFHRYGFLMEPYLESFDDHLQANSIFAYLDHPFSTAYQYGWNNETERIAAHQNLIQHMKNVDKILFWNLRECMDFLFERNQINIWSDGQGNVEWRGKTNGKRIGNQQYAYSWMGMRNEII